MNELIQRSPEWLEMRSRYIGSSDAPVIMGVSPWKTPYQLWQEKVGLAEQREPTKAMIYGNEKEEDARKSFEKDTGLIMFPQVIFSEEQSFMMASLDGMDIDGINVVELKCPGKEDHELAKRGIVPSHYIPQLMHQIFVAKLDFIWYYSFDGNSGILLKINRDDAYIIELIKKEKEFYDCVQSFIPPTLTDKDHIVKDDDLWLECASEWLKVREDIRKLEAKENEIREQLISMCNGQSSKGGGIRVSNTTQKGSINYKKIPELENVDLDLYRSPPVSYWKIVRSEI